MRIYLLALLLALACSSSPAANPVADALATRARSITITRDEWGIPHVTGKTDADVVFGVVYAQAEDDFNRIEVNYLNSLGRMAEAEGEKAIWSDLRQRLFINADTLKLRYAESPAGLRTLMDAWADGLNYFLATHQDVKPRVLTKFEPWMALSFTEGSIGGDIERISLEELEAFYGGAVGAVVSVGAVADSEPRGSNGIAIAPANTASGKAMLLINPHTSFFFRAVAQMTSEEGLNAYGAMTWGQFFIYQGFNERMGWMHTSSGADVIDEYAESIVTKDGKRFYKYGKEERPVVVDTVRLRLRTAAGLLDSAFVTYHTQHGPIVRKAGEKWIAVDLMNEPIQALTQSYGRTKAKTIAEFKQMLDLHTNSSNNTVYADADGNIAYFHANHVPRRDPKFDWDKPVDGSNPATDYQGVHTLDESPNVVNPPNGWVQNTNNGPWSAAGGESPKVTAYPAYFDRYGQNPRGLHAIRVLTGRKGFTLDSLIGAAYDTYLTAFADILPPLISAYDGLTGAHLVDERLAEPIAALKGWDYRWSASSVPTTLAVFWGEELARRTRKDAESELMSVYEYMAKRTRPIERVEALAAAVDTLTARFGTWKTPWGDINRFQRLTGDIVQPFSDSGPSIAVPFPSAVWGSLASFGAREYPGTKKRYGTSGNSFVAVVEFGDSVRARAVTAGGESGNPASPHFKDQAQRYADGDLQDVWFYPNQLKGHTQRQYQPGK
ncbi:MAG TPA: penicillin acylase family protein [Gemmatimonadales bacterium]|nr:penicillin acylase family protein [Gemmatimonadales bacterium]